MNCEQVKKISSGYLKDAIPKEHLSEVEKHLDICPACNYLMEQMNTLRIKIRNCLCNDDCCPEKLKKQICQMLSKKQKL